MWVVFEGERAEQFELRRDAKQMQSRIEPFDWSMQSKMGFRYNGCITMQSK